MRIALNLSSEPFRRDRALVVASIAAGLALSGLLAMLISLATHERGRVAETRQEIAELQRTLAGLGREQAQLEGLLARPENAAVLDRVHFVNSLLYRKGVSWTRIFSDLESVMPYDVRLYSIRPSINARNEVYLEMVVAAQSERPVIGLLMNLENSPLFGQTEMPGWAPPTQSEPLYRYRVSVNYRGKT
jgi:type IV pilus assembly protein PilN